MVVFFFKQKTAYEVRISDWSSDVCSSDLNLASESRAASTLRLPSTILLPPSAASILAVQTKTLASLPSLPRHTKYFWFTRAVSWMTSGGTPRYDASKRPGSGSGHWVRPAFFRLAERRVGKEGVRTDRSRWSRDS